jgi:predicted small secreted protein
MKKQILMTSAMAATLTSLSGCSSNDGWDEDVYADNDTEICVDEMGRRIDDDECERSSGRSGGFYVANYGRPYYLNRGSAIPYKGDSIHDSRYNFFGTDTPRAGASYAKAPESTRMSRSSAIARGGMGSSSRGFGGGRS